MPMKGAACIENIFQHLATVHGERINSQTIKETIVVLSDSPLQAGFR